MPRPIGWISTLSKDGRPNLAPYSQFNNLTFDPPYVMFSSNQTTDGQRKDTVINAESTGHFVWQLATYDLREAVNITAEQLPYGEDEFERAGLDKEKARLTDIPMVKRSPVKFECDYHSTIRLPGNPPMVSTTSQANPQYDIDACTRGLSISSSAGSSRYISPMRHLLMAFSM